MRDKEEILQKKTNRVMMIEVFINVFLAIGKLLGGFFSGSSALLSDGVDSSQDVLTSLVALFAKKEASKKADAEHQFGHQKIENLFAMLFGIVIFATGCFLLYEGIISIVNKEYLLNENRKIDIALYVSLGALIIKLFMGIYTKIYANITKSPILAAQAIDHFMDSISTFISTASLLTIFLLINNVNEIAILDPIASIVISTVILFGAIRIVYTNATSLLDKACKKQDEEKFKNLVLEDKRIEHIDALRSRVLADKVFLEIEITVDEHMSLKEAHEIAESARERIIKNSENVHHCLIHVNPSDHHDENDL